MPESRFMPSQFDEGYIEYLLDERCLKSLPPSAPVFMSEEEVVRNGLPRLKNLKPSENYLL